MRDEITKNDDYSQWRPRSLTVLVAEDEPEIRACVKTLLESEGFKVIATDNGYSALAIIQEFGDCIDVLLLDMNMPIMGGEWVLREMKTRRHRVPVVIHSGMAPEEIWTKCKGAEIHSILRKPCSSASIIEAVSAASGLGETRGTDGNPAMPGPAKEKGVSAR